MRLKFFPLIFLLSVTFLSTSGLCLTKNADKAGAWYPSDSAKLKAMLDTDLAEAGDQKIDGDIIAIISPHAGYSFSAPIAAFGYKAIQGKDIRLAVIIGFNHAYAHSGVAVCDYDSYHTPLGDVAIDKGITDALIKADNRIYPRKEAFSDEQSTELQIPFVQEALPGVPVVILSIGDQSIENCRMLSDALYKVLKGRDDFVIIASSDMCHYLPYDKNNEVDAYTINALMKFDPEQFFASSELNGHRLMCGYGAVCAAMMTAKKFGADRVHLLKHLNSGDISFDKRAVVGYLSAAMVKSAADEPDKQNDPGETKMLNQEQRKKMLNLARKSIEFYLKEGKRLPVTENDPVLNLEMGAFVTLHEKGQLRGCIGNMVGRGPFYLTVRDMAVEAATQDPRFPAVSPEEMKDIDIEISALSPLERITDPNKIVAGRHGVLVRQGNRSGVYLPQVATEQGWDRDEFMDSLCAHKAGIGRDSWRTGKCEMYIFTAEVFGEKE